MTQTFLKVVDNSFNGNFGYMKNGENYWKIAPIKIYLMLMGFLIIFQDFLGETRKYLLGSHGEFGGFFRQSCLLQN